MGTNFWEEPEGEEGNEYWEQPGYIDQGEPTVGTPEVNEIREDGQVLMTDLQNQAGVWRNFAEAQYNNVQNLIEGWENPADINETLELVDFGNIQGAPMIWDGFSVGQADLPDADAPGGISLQGDDAITMPNMPVVDFSFPELDFTGEPEDYEVSDPGDSPVLTTPLIPDNPDIVMPDPPTIEDINLPPDIAVSMPEFLAQPPDTEIALPEGFYYVEASYDSNLYNSIVSKLIADIEAASSGIDEDAEQAIYDRAVSRMDVEMDKAQQQAENYFAAKGFELPPGALSGRLLELQSADLRAKEDLNNDILVQRSNLVQQNMQALVNSGLQLEQLLREFHGQVQGREFAKQQEIAQNAVAIYNARIEKLNAMTSVYNTEADVYRTRIQGELAKVETFKAIIEKARVTAEVQEQLVRVYTARLDGVKTLAEIYRTRMDSARIHSEVEISRVTAYRAAIDAYTARVQANTARWQGYQSKVEAQRVKAAAYGERVNAYQSEVQAYATKAGTDIDAARLKIEQNQGRINHYLADIEKFQQEANLAIQAAQTSIGNEDLKIRTAQTNQAGDQAVADNQVQRENVRLQALNTRATQEAEQLRANINGKIEEYRLQLEKMKSQASVLTQIAASALSAINSNLSYGFSGSVSGNLSVQSGYSRSDSTQRSASAGKSRSRSSSVSHNYHYGTGGTETETEETTE